MEKTNIIKSYYLLTKPGIIYGNAITVIAGFFLAAKGHPNFFLLLITLLGISFVIASACVLNNYIDRTIDEKMQRTKNRALVKKIIPVRNAIVYGSFLGFLGFFLLVFYTNFLTAFVAFIGFFFYVVMYSIWKRRSIYGTIVGSVSGAVPPVVGYCAVINQFDIGALLLFLLLVFWQMPHFYAIAIFRADDYAAASIPVLPIKKGILTTKKHIVAYILAFLLTAISLTFFGYTSFLYLIVALGLSTTWFWFGVNGFKKTDNKRWARKMFGMSLLVLTLLSLMITIDGFLPKI
ncbi:MAG TPA: heme o synthase [Methylomirabilota bacterium]|nr:heme o synthase [Methylomirabilota bacterium]